MTRRIRFNAFDMNCVAHQSPGLWRHPADQSQRYTDIGYWTGLATLLERGVFDGLFIADVLGTYDVYGGTDEAALREGAQIPVADPILLVSAMAAATQHLGFGITTGTGFEHPYPFARRLSTLDHLTQGRIGWNVVTGYLPSAARNFGAADQLDHDARYDHADEYLEVLYKLWEGSWEDGAVVRDRERGVYVDADKVHHIGHRGEHFSVPGIHLSEPSPQRTPVIYQAGASPRGIRFASEHAEAIFVAAPSKRVLRETVRRIRQGLVAAGRAPDAARIYALATIITDRTDAAAAAKHEEFKRYASLEGGLVFTSGWMGIDLSRYDLDEPIGNVESNAIRSAVAAFQESGDDGREWLVRDIAEWASIGGLGPRFVGSGNTVADQLQKWVSDTGVDGFNLAYAITPGSFEDVITHVVPVLQERGAYPATYSHGTLREKLFGLGARLPDGHRGVRYRPGGDLSTITSRYRADVS
ncbi:LLM class flavin-dependent oxidoreductase [Hoyosella sp. YIM 151337]|uniref:LLM class flavin-dependent oxidoreductase n=1 Tax=Hoyosella sp. YIM 151337 TaxID=2992742 RepID=UPI002235E1FA|nr:LLM class flavin-dependent oxidoreductase [Hoyosella sp. YIM 151337]MCW4352381.1 LLM class flavin-dependent oxidoreductase [Hoyosella sp. YIM 151337]